MNRSLDNSTRRRHTESLSYYGDSAVAALDQGGIPDLYALHQVFTKRYPYLLQSIAANKETGRYDVLFCFPQQTLCLGRDGGLVWDGGSQTSPASFLDTLDSWWCSVASQSDSSREMPLPFRGGWFLYLSYELAQQIEPVLKLPQPGEHALPIAFATRVPAAVVVDRVTQQCFVVVERGDEDLIDAVVNDINAVSKADGRLRDEFFPVEVIEDEPERYLDGVRRIKDYIIAGDVFQVNLSRAWRASAARAISPTALYRRLCQSNPGPFAGLVQYGDHAIVSSSPERLVSVRDGLVETRPIAGTRPRGQQGKDDVQLSKRLLGHPKERAEHIMLIDLERNDLGRVCEPGTVRVNELMTLETYRHVHHIVSNVQGRRCAGVTPGQIISALFPGGTITGCPKVRCMEIIAELEATPRGAYTGSFGYLNRDGDMDLNILIRTIAVSGNQAVLRAGAGIVADSVPEMELKESRDKAKGLLLALNAQV